MARVISFAQLPVEYDGIALHPTSDHADLTAAALDQAIGLLSGSDEKPEDVSVIAICAVSYTAELEAAVALKKSIAKVFVVPLPNSWLLRPHLWLVSRAGSAAVVNAL
jgi:hypothetical protein